MSETTFIDAGTDVPDAPDARIIRGTEAADLAALYDPDVVLVTAPAPAGPEGLLYAEALAGGKLRRSVVQVGTPDGVPAAGSLDPLAAGMGEHALAWVSYLERVTELFACLLGARVVGVRQIVADGPHCPRFHVDQVHARGVITVVGSCTEWLEEPDVDRSRLGHAGGPDDMTSGLVRSWDRLGRLAPCELAVFKGAAWPGASDRAVVHRSPPADGQRRVVLTLDWME